MRSSFVTILFLVTLVLGLTVSPNLFAITIFVGDAHTAVIVPPTTTVAQLRVLIFNAGFDPNSITVPVGRAGRALSSFGGGALVLDDLGIQDNASFLANIRPPTPEERFLGAAREGDVVAITAKLNQYLTEVAKMGWITGCQAVDDHSKIAVYYAARQGNLAVLQEIRRQVGAVHFRTLMSVRDTDNRTVLMAAAQAVQDRVNVIDFVRANTPANLLDAEDIQRCTALDWALVRHYTDRATAAAILGGPAYASYPAGHRHHCLLPLDPAAN